MIPQDKINEAAHYYASEMGTFDNYTFYKRGFENGVEWTESQTQWISVKDRLPELGQEVYCYQPKKYGYKIDKTWEERCLIGYLFEFKENERSGFINLNEIGDNKCNIRKGGVFWSFPYICHQNFVTHWMPLPTPPQI